MSIELDSPEWTLLRNTAHVLVERVEAAGISGLTNQERVFFCVWIADGEVGNGGFHAVCYNSTGNYLRHFPEAFRAIGDAGRAQLFEALIKLFGPDGPSPEHETRVQQHEALSEETAAQIDVLDEAYFSSAQDVTQRLYDFRLSWLPNEMGP